MRVVDVRKGVLEEGPGHPLGDRLVALGRQLVRLGHQHGHLRVLLPPDLDERTGPRPQAPCLTHRGGQREGASLAPCQFSGVGCAQVDFRGSRWILFI